MSWTVVIWLISAGVCITLAAVHLLVWLRDQNAHASLAFSLWTTAVAISALFELAMMHSPTQEKFAVLLGATAFPFAVMAIAYIAFIRLYLRAGRRWLMWSIFGIVALELLVKVTVLPTLPFVEIADLQHIPLWGETLVAPVGVKSPWSWITGLLVMSELAFIGNAAVEAWRGDRRRRVKIVAVAACGSTAFSVAIAVLMMRAELPPPITFTLPSMFTILVMAYGLSSDLIKVSQMSQDLRTSQERVSLAAKAANLGMWEWDIARDIFWLNETSRGRLGVGESGRITFKRFLESLHPDDREPTHRAMYQALEGSMEVQAEYRVVTPEGTIRWTAASGQVVRSPNGKPLFVRGVSMDITERKRAEEQLIEAEERYRTVADFTYDWETWQGPDGKYIYVSPSCERITGYKQGEFIDNAHLFDEIVLPEDRGTWEEHNEGVQGEYPLREVQLRIKRKDGAVRWIEHVCQPVIDDSGKFLGFRASNRDITERKQAEAALKQSEERLKEAQHIAHIGNWELDLLTNTLTWSDEIFRIFEIDKERFGASYEFFLLTVHPEDREAVNTAYTQSLETHKPYDIIHRLLMPDGRVKYVQEQCETFYSPERKPLRSVGTVQDITERKQAESERIQLRNDLAHIQRVSTMGQISSALAHELNQPLGAILNNASTAQILSSKLNGGKTELGEILADIISDATRAGEVIRRIRGAVKKGETKFEQLNLNVLIEEVVELYRNVFNIEKISIFLELQPNLVPIRGDRVQLQQVLMNLINNASEAMRESSSKKSKIRSAMPSSDMVIVSVSDSGTGIDEAKKDKVFEPFFSTKKEGLGMGLGISRSIIQEHGGRLWVENNPDVGATFSFSLKAYRGDSG